MEMESAWTAFCQKVKLNEMRRELGMEPIYLPDDKTRSLMQDTGEMLIAVRRTAKEARNG